MSCPQPRPVWLGLFLCGVRRPMKWRRSSGISNKVFSSWPRRGALHDCVKSQCAELQAYLVLDLHSEGAEHYSSDECHCDDGVAVGHGVSLLLLAPAFPAIDSSQLSSLTRLLCEHHRRRGRRLETAVRDLSHAQAARTTETTLTKHFTVFICLRRCIPYHRRGECYVYPTGE